MKFDVAIIGAGVSGVSIARKLSAYQLSIALIEKECDVSFGTSKANSGIIHAGFHHHKKYLKTKLEVQGNLMFDRLQKELDFPFKRCGILVAAFKTEELATIEHLYTRGIENQVIGIEMCSRERMLELEPRLNADVIGGLHAPGGGIIEPYRFVFASLESAKKNGVKLYTNFKVVRSTYSDSFYTLYSEQDEHISARYVINAAGLYADKVSHIFRAEDFTIIPRKGEYYLLDRMSKAKPSKVLFPVPSPVSKGMLVIPTVEDTVLIGPTAVEIEDKEDFSTNAHQLDKIFHSARKMVSSISVQDAITSFAGLRPALKSGDFYIEVSQKIPNFIQVAGIQSPGLTAAPALAEYVKNLLKSLGCNLTEKVDYNPYIEKFPHVRNLSPAQVDQLSKENPLYSRIVCRCEKVSEAEIVEAIKHGHTSIDGIKFFTRSGMGRCQGGFCSYKILKIIMRETGLSYDAITKRGGESFLLRSKL